MSYYFGALKSLPPPSLGTIGPYIKPSPKLLSLGGGAFVYRAPGPPPLGHKPKPQREREGERGYINKIASKDFLKKLPIAPAAPAFFAPSAASGGALSFKTLRF